MDRNQDETMNQRLDSLDKLQRIDHDTLTRLETKFDLFASQILNDVGEVKNGTTTKIAELDVRVRSLEKTHEELNPRETKKHVDTLWIERSNRVYNNKFIIGLSSAISTIITLTITILAFIFKLFPILK